MQSNIEAVKEAGKVTLQMELPTVETAVWKCEQCGSEKKSHYGKICEKCYKLKFYKTDSYKKYEYTRKHKSNYIEYMKNYRSISYNKEKHRLCCEKRNKKPERKFYTYKLGAKQRNLIFDVSFEQFMTFWQKPCHYCGDKIETIGLDRVDNKKGYTIDNIVPCCTECNYAKGALENPRIKISKLKNILAKMEVLNDSSCLGT